jgi:hypothetical protein
MKQVVVRRIGVSSIYMLIPSEVVRAVDLKHNDLAYLMPIEGKPDQFLVRLVKAPVPQELVNQATAVEAV